MGHSRLRTLIARLTGEGADEAWRELLNEIWPILLRVVHYVERDRDDVADCFLLICEAFRRNNFARLRRFDPEGAARLRRGSIAGEFCHGPGMDDDRGQGCRSERLPVRSEQSGSAADAVYAAGPRARCRLCGIRLVDGCGCRIEAGARRRARPQISAG